MIENIERLFSFRRCKEMTTSLSSGECFSVGEANEIFSANQGMIILLPSRSCISFGFSFSVPSGCYALVTSHGRDIDYLDENEVRSSVWPEGLHFPYPPWVRISHLITKQSVVIDFEVAECRTQDGISVSITSSLTFRIMGDFDLDEDSCLVKKLVHEVTPEGLYQKMKVENDKAVRALAKDLIHSEIFGIRSCPQEDENEMGSFYLSDDSENFADESIYQMVKIRKGENANDFICMRLNQQFIPIGVEIQSAIIRQISLPAGFSGCCRREGHNLN
mmetsp:Transcript_25922/g.29640  ORF Transcript_25922/g.29640 Transcript_25922/m.29640 type:complete len:276 (-) Transcript_25922:749-1576(-)